MEKFRITIRAPAKTKPEAVAGFIQSGINKALGGRGACEAKAHDLGPSEPLVKDEQKTIWVDLDIIRNLKSGDNKKVSDAIQSGASARGGRVIDIKKYPSDGIDHDAVRKAIEGRA